MCGIAGIALGVNRVLPDMRQRLLAMQEAMAHRGPDDDGLYTSADDRLGLVNCRLAIRDRSPAGHMPMSNAEGTIWITYNGEIYNTDEPRSELERLGHTFVSESDTEVILRGYEAWGEQVVERLRGIFAFAILDLRSENGVSRLLLVRDRVGIKPLYYAGTPDLFVFASELKGLLASGLVSRENSPAGLVGYLMLGAVPDPLTVYHNVYALESACMLNLPLRDVALVPSQTRYWFMPTDTDESANHDDAVEEVRKLLEESVRIRLVGDVPLGAFLSGGLDSSSVVALMRKATSGPLRTCSMIFAEHDYNEASYSRAVAKAVGAEHYERLITSQDVEKELDHIMWAMDQPTVDGVNTYFVSKVAREAGLTVALSGLGGDELFGGYPKTFRGVPRLLYALRLAQATPLGNRVARAALEVLPNHRRWAKVQDALNRPPSIASAYLTHRGLFSPSEVRSLVTPEVWEAAMKVFEPVAYITKQSKFCTKGNPSAIFDWVSHAELSTYTCNQLLRDTDIMSMAHSLEVRVPLLDHRLVEAVLRLSPGIKSIGSGLKPFLTKVMEEILPPTVLERKRKQGFTFPFELWLRGGLQKRMEASLNDVGSESWLQADAVRGVWADYQRKKRHWAQVWSLALLAGWRGSRAGGR